MKLEIRFVRFDIATMKYVEVDDRVVYETKRMCDITRKVNSYMDTFVVGKYAERKGTVIYRAMLRQNPFNGKYLPRDKTVHVTIHDEDGKLADIKSASTSCKLNLICRYRAELKGSVCTFCYAQNELRYKAGLRKWLEWNYAVLNLGVLDKDDLPTIFDDIFRIESFGDVATVFCAINYINMIRKNKGTWFSVWTKNPSIWNAAMKIKGTPRNATFLVSSPFVNVRLNLEAVKAVYPWVDKTFTVYDNGTESNCAGLGCRHQCGRCYGKKSKKSESDVRENLRLVGGKKR